MSEEPFETALARIFAGCGTALATSLDKAKARAEALQAEDTSRLAFTLTETIEHAIIPALDEALAGYDDALDQPVISNPRWEAATRGHIEAVVATGISRALAFDELVHPWKPLLKQEAPKLRDRMLATVEERFAELHRRRGPRRRAQARREWMLRLALLALGVVLGIMLRSLIAA